MMESKNDNKIYRKITTSIPSLKNSYYAQTQQNTTQQN